MTELNTSHAQASILNDYLAIKGWKKVEGAENKEDFVTGICTATVFHDGGVEVIEIPVIEIIERLEQLRRIFGEADDYDR